MSNPSAAQTERPPGAIRRAILHLMFLVTVFGKLALGAGQLIGGVALWLAPAGAISRAMTFISEHELAEDADNRLWDMLLDWAGSVTPSVETFYTIYLLGHGVLNFGVALLLLTGARSATVLSIWVLVGFAVYQLYEYTRTGDPAMIVLTIIDVIVILLALFELHRLKRKELAA